MNVAVLVWLGLIRGIFRVAVLWVGQITALPVCWSSCTQLRPARRNWSSLKEGFFVGVCLEKGLSLLWVWIIKAKNRHARDRPNSALLNRLLAKERSDYLAGDQPNIHFVIFFIYLIKNKDISYVQAMVLMHYYTALLFWHYSILAHFP